MRIEGIASEAFPQLRAKKIQKNTSPTVFKKILSDSFAPSKTLQNSPSPRALAIESIKSKINSGYYDRESVVDDITDKLAQLFNKE